MKLAICVSGQPRGLPLASEQIKNFLIAPNQHDYDIDVFVHAWFDEEEAGQNFVSAQPGQNGKVGIVHPDTEDILLNVLNPTDIIVEPPAEFTFADDLKQAPTAVQRNLASMFYSLYIADVLRRRHERKHDFTYDVVIRVRHDLWYYNTPIHFVEYQESVDDGFVCTSKRFQDERMNPNFHGGYTLTDIFVFGSSEVMTDLSNTYLNFSFMNTRCSPPYGENYLGYQTREISGNRIMTIPLQYEILHRVVDINSIGDV